MAGRRPSQYPPGYSIPENFVAETARAIYLNSYYAPEAAVEKAEELTRALIANANKQYSPE